MDNMYLFSRLYFKLFRFLSILSLFINTFLPLSYVPLALAQEDQLPQEELVLSPPSEVIETPVPAPTFIEPSIPAPSLVPETPTPTPESTPAPVDIGVLTPPGEPSPTPDPLPSPTPEPTPGENVSDNIAPANEPVPQPTDGLVSTPSPVPQACQTDNQISDLAPEDWSLNDGIYQTNKAVELGVRYVFPLNNNVTVTFKCLPSDVNLRTPLKIQQIKISDLNLPDSVNPATEFAYDVTTGMTDGTFEYDLTLPKPSDTSTQLSYIEKSASEVISSPITPEDLKPVEESKLEQQSELIKAVDLNHFTIYIVTANVRLSGAVNGSSQVTAAPGQSITVTLNVDTSGSGSADEWRSSGYKIGTGNWQCTDTPNHNNDGNYTETFTINAPNSVGVYNLSLRAYNRDDCSTSNSSDYYESPLPNAITVVAPTPTSPPTTNPSLPQACGLDIALVLDVSGSIDNSELTQMKNAFKSFVDALTGTPTQFSVTQFSTTATILQSFTNDFALVKSKIDSAGSGNYTNWEDGLVKAQSTFDPRADKPNMVIFSSDGNPNRVGTSGSSATESQAVAAAVSIANTIKSGGTRILGIGIGSDLDSANMVAITGPNVNTGNVLTSDLITTDFSGLAAQLAAFASQTCGGKISINKFVDGVQKSDGQRWTFTIDNGTTLVADTNGQLVSNTLPVGLHSVSEVAIPVGYVFDHASCTNGTPDPSINGVKDISITSDNIISCNFYNNTQKGSITIIKDAIPNDSQDFYFSTTGIGLTAFTLDDDADPTLNNSKSFTNLKAGVYSVTEITSPSWSGQSVCVSSLGDTETPASLELDANETITCTFTNTKLNPLLEVKKSSPTTSVTTAGQIVPYTFNLTNHGNQILTNITVTDTKCDSPPTYISGDTNLDSKLDLSETWIYTCNHTVSQSVIDAGGSLVNTVTADSSESEPDTDTLTIPISQSPSLKVTKTANVSYVDQSGDVITYTVEVNNTGTTTLTNVSVSDPLLANLDCNSQLPGYQISSLTINVGQKLICTGTYTVSTTDIITNGNGDGDIDNNVTVFSAQTNPQSAVFAVPLLRSRIIVKKVTLPPTDPITSFNFGSTYGSSFNLSHGQTMVSPWLGAGTYTIWENNLSGWSLSDLTCQDPDGGTTYKSPNVMVDLDSGEEIVCTYTNSRDTGNLKVVKSVDDGSDLTAWSFSLNGAPPIRANAQGEVDFGQVPTLVNHTIVESGPSGYHFVQVAGTGCSQIGSGSAQATVAKGGATVCLFTNAVDKGSLTIIKDSSPDSPQDFAFTSTLPGHSAFSLDDDADPTLSNTLTVTNLMPGTYSVSEQVLAGWDLTSVVCSDQSPASSIVISPGENVTCTFTNLRSTGSLKVNKYVDLNGDGDWSDSNETSSTNANQIGFRWSINNGDPQNMGATQNNIPTGNYSVFENNVANYSFTAWYVNGQAGKSCSNPNGTSLPISVDILKNTTSEITLCNTRQTGTVVVHKDVQNPTGGAVVDTSTQFTVNLDDSNPKTITDGQIVTYAKVLTGSHTITESPIPSAYTYFGITPDVDGNKSNGAQIEVGANQIVDVYITNRQKTARIVVIKDVRTPSGADVGDTTPFTVQLNGASGQIFSESQSAQYDVNPGSGFSVTEQPNPAFEQMGCKLPSGAPASNFSIASNQTIQVTCTNWQKKATINVVKDVLAADGTTQVSDSHQFRSKLNGSQEKTFSETVSAIYSVDPGTHTITENTDHDYIYVACTPDSNPNQAGAQLKLLSNQTVTVTCTNKQKPSSITIIKDSRPNSDTNFEFTRSWGSDFTLDDDGNNGNTYSNHRDFNGLNGGTYTITEKEEPGWYLGDITCVGSGITKNLPARSVNISLSPGRDVSCTFTNFKLGRIEGEKFNDKNGNRVDDGSWEPDLPGFKIFIDANNNQLFDEGETFDITDSGGDYSFANLMPGTYQVCEVQQPGWFSSLPNQAVCQNTTIHSEGGDIDTLNFGNHESVTIKAHKIVCAQESDLPNWGLGAPDISSATAQNYIDTHPGCHFEQGWEFQYGFAGQVSKYGSGSQQGLAPAPWQLLGTTSADGFAQIQLSDSAVTSGVWIRENLKTNYVPFSSPPAGLTSDNFSAEIYCHTDGRNYDNYDQVASPLYGSTYYCVAFNALNYGKIAVSKFEDHNLNGQKDDTDGPLSGWQFGLYQGSDCQGQPMEPGVLTTSTDGLVEFTSLVPGQYSVKEESLSSGWSNTTSLCQNATVVSQLTTNLNFGNYQKGTIIVEKYEDTDGVVGKSENEELIGDPAFNFRLYQVVNNTWSLVAGAATQADGRARFDHVISQNGDYRVCEVKQEGWEETRSLNSPANNLSGASDEYGVCESVAVNGSSFEATLQFGNIHKGTVKVYKFNDLNANGTRDEGEPLLPDWEIYASSGDTHKTTQVTDIGGQTVFSLTPGQYTLGENLQDGWYQSNIYCENTGEGVKITQPGYAYGHHGACSGWNQCGDAQTCALKACQANGYSTLVSYGDQKPCTQFNNCSLFHDISRDLTYQANWGNWCNVMGVTDIVCANGSSSTPTPTPTSGDQLVNKLLGINKVYAQDSDSSNTLQIDVNPGQTKSCYIGNYQMASVTVNKEVLTHLGQPVDDKTLFNLAVTGRSPTTFGEQAPATFSLKPGTYTFSETDIGPKYQLKSANNIELTLKSGQSESLTFTNWKVKPRLVISKYNDQWPNIKSPGSQVKYTIKLTVLDGDISDVEVTDLPPAGFKYRPGSYSVDINGVGVGITEPKYSSPGKWFLGSLEVGSTVTMSYLADIDSSVDPGLYKDIAWAFGCSESADCDLTSEDKLLAVSQDAGTVDSGVVADNFVGTKIQLTSTSYNSQSANIVRQEQGQVLGAATELPATGSATFWLIFGLLSTIIGSLMVFRFRFVGVIVVALMALSSLTAHAANSPNIFVRLENPLSPTNQSQPKIDYVALDMLGRQLNIQCYKINPDSAQVALGPSQTLKSGGNSGQCDLANSPMSDSGKDYSFYVLATVDSEEFKSDTVTVRYDTNTPGTPGDYSKEHPDACKYIIKFRAANDNRTVKIQIYRSDKTEFTADGGTKVGEVGIQPDQSGSYTDVVGDCYKPYYYVIRAFDEAGNGSSLTGDSVTVTAGTVTSPSTSVAAPVVVSTTDIAPESISPTPSTDLVATPTPSSTETGNVLGTRVQQAAQKAVNLVGNNKRIAFLLFLAGVVLISYALTRRRSQ